MARRASGPSCDLGKLVGRRIRELRQENEWNQVDLEHQLDGAISQATLSHYEVSRYMPSIQSVEQIAGAFDVPAALLFLDPSRSSRDRAAAKILTMKSKDVQRVLALLEEITQHENNTK